jgi:chromosome segregation ATPase
LLDSANDSTSLWFTVTYIPRPRVFLSTKQWAYKLCNLMFAEYEERVRRRRERRRDLSERRAAKAAALEAARAAIQDREELVAKLEEEKEKLEQLLAEWEERQVKEVSQLWKA